jgi:hypothetical protein
MMTRPRCDVSGEVSRAGRSRTHDLQVRNPAYARTERGSLRPLRARTGLVRPVASDGVAMEEMTDPMNAFPRRALVAT